MDPSPTAPVQLRPSITTKSYVRERVEEREANEAARRQLAATTPAVLKLLAVEVFVLALAIVLVGRPAEDRGYHTAVFATVLVSSLMELLVGWPTLALMGALFELFLRAVPSWICDQLTGARRPVLWPVGIALALVPAAFLFATRDTFSFGAFGHGWGTLAAFLELGNGVFLWWIMRRHGFWGVVWCRTCLVVGVAAATVALSWLA